MPSDTQSKAAAKDLSTEVNSLAVDDMDLAGISNLQALGNVLGNAGVKSEDYSESYSSGFEVLDNKDRLIGKPLFFVQWRFTDSKKFDGQFVSAYVVTYDEASGDIIGKFIVNDGSTGIARQLRTVTDARIKANHPQPQAGLKVGHGLRKSEYETEQQQVNRDTGEVETVMVAGTTYYLA